MSNSKTAIQEIKSLMVKFGFMKSESFLDAKLVDGTEIKVDGDSLMEGAKVMVVTEEGEIPAPDGTHEIEGGVKVQTTDGIVVKVEDPAMEEEPKAEEEMEEESVEVEVPQEVAPIAEPVVEAIVEAIVPVLEEIKSLADEMKKMKEQMSSVKSDFETFKKQPAGKKISDGKTDFNKELSSEDARIATIMSLRKK
jgi:hypothetical protein